MTYKSFILLVTFLILLPTNADDVMNNEAYCEEDFDNINLCTPIRTEVINDPCSDENELCEFWANEGECEVNPGYMLNKCAKSCNECTKYTEFENSSPNRVENYNFGIDQTFFGSEDDFQETKLYIEKMKKYEHQFMNARTTTKKMLEICTNQLDICAYHAVKGLCQSKNTFMMENCPLACMMCDKKEQFDRCVGMRHPFSTPLFVGKEMFDRKMNDIVDKGEGYRLKTVESFFASFKKTPEVAGVEIVDEKIMRFGNFLSDGECKSLIQLGDKIGWNNATASNQIEAATAGLKGGTPSQSFFVAKCSGSTEIDDDGSNIIKVIMEKIVKLTNIALEYFEPPTILHYPEAHGFHSLHHANNAHDNWNMAGPKVLSIYIPLSNVKRGGHLGFPSLDWLMIPPRQGQMILWSNVLNSDPESFDDKMGSEILPVQEGDMYALQIHVHQYDFKTAFARGCS